MYLRLADCANVVLPFRGMEKLSTLTDKKTRIFIKICPAIFSGVWLQTLTSDLLDIIRSLQILSKTNDKPTPGPIQIEKVQTPIRIKLVFGLAIL